MVRDIDFVGEDIYTTETLFIAYLSRLFTLQMRTITRLKKIIVCGGRMSLKLVTIHWLKKF